MFSEGLVGEDVINANSPHTLSTANLDECTNAIRCDGSWVSICDRDNSHGGLVCSCHQPNMDVTCWGEVHEGCMVVMALTPTRDTHVGLVTSAHQAPGAPMTIVAATSTEPPPWMALAHHLPN